MHDADERNSATQALRGLFWLRGLAIAAQLGFLTLVTAGLGMSLPLAPMLAVTALLVLWNAYTRWRLGRQRDATSGEIATHLLIDTAALSLLLYFSGGATNPFVSMLLVPVALAAAYLPARLVLAVTGAAILAYTLLMRWYLPLPPVPEGLGDGFRLHVWGMWANFVLGALIVALFVHRLARAGRRRERELAEARETLMRNAHIVSAGALAAGMAHALNTPLSTIGLLARELLDTPELPPQAREDAREILDQLAHCRHHLRRLQHEGRPDRDGEVRELLERIGDWAALRADLEIRIDCELPADTPVPRIEHLLLALTNLLDNAADASLQNGDGRVRVTIGRDDRRRAFVQIEDTGPGLAPAQRRRAGRRPFSSKRHGLGLGLVLTHATLEGLGATLDMRDRPEGGLCTRVTFDEASTT